jgi:hypothetical protein
MNKRTKIWIGVGVGALALYLLFRPKLSMGGVLTNPLGTGGNTTMPCPAGEVKCEKSEKCYNPALNYLKDPCA